MKTHFPKIDFKKFWKRSAHAKKSYTETTSTTPALIREIEKEIGGYKLPAAYIELCKTQNGGTPRNTCFPTSKATSWAGDHISITGIMGIGRDKPHSLCGEHGSNFMIKNWEYPKIGVCIADTPSAGHDMIMLDYRKCGKTGEPRVVHVDQEHDYKITLLAKTFADFINGLVHEDRYDTSAEDELEDFKKVRTGTFSPILLKAFEKTKRHLPDAPEKLRALAGKIVRDKGHFSLHADEHSMLMYDLMFWFYSSYNHAKSVEHYLNNPKQFETSYDLPSYSLMIAISICAEPYGFCTGGYAPGFITDWWKAREASGALVKTARGYKLTDNAVTQMLATLERLTATTSEK